MLASHGYVVDVFNVTREDGIDAVADGFMDRFMRALGSGGGSKDKYIKVEEEPPERGGVNGECIHGGDCLDGMVEFNLLGSKV
jgi:hypothetical protein